MEKIYVSFHIGRGGRFHNPGFVTFLGEFDFQAVIQRNLNNVFLCVDEFNENGKQVELPKEQWRMEDGNGRVLLSGEEIFAKTGVLNFDNDYDTDCTRVLEDCSEKEWDALRRALKTNERYLMSDGLKNAIIEHFGIDDDD